VGINERERGATKRNFEKKEEKNAGKGGKRNFFKEGGEGDSKQ